MDGAIQDVGSSEVAPIEHADPGRSRRVGLRRCLLAEGLVAVVVLDALGEHELKVAPSEDEHPVETFSPDGADEARAFDHAVDQPPAKTVRPEPSR